MVGWKWEFISYLVVQIQIPSTSFEQLYEECMICHLLRKKPRQEML